QQFAGISILVIYYLGAPDGSSVTAVKRIIASTNPVKNNNPTVTGILLNGSNISVLPPAGSVVSANINPSSYETYNVFTPSGGFSAVTEELTTTYYASDGSWQISKVAEP